MLIKSLANKFIMPKIKPSKKAFELSINFLVVMIISIAVFGLGITFINKIYRGAEKTQEQYFEQYERQIQDLVCDSRDLVCIPKDTIDLSKEKYPGYGVVITNVLGGTGTSDKNKFNLNVEFNVAYDRNNEPICYKNPPPVHSSKTEDQCGSPTNWIKHDTSQIEIKNNAVQRKAIALAVKGAKSGTYIFDVEVSKCKDPTFTPNSCSDFERYSNLQKIYLYVP